MTATSDTAGIAATYDAAADHFDAGPLAFWDRYGRRTVERLALAAGAEVLDVGCGTGASALPAAEAVGPSGHVLGVDLSENLLALARAKARRLGHGNVRFETGDMTALGFDDGRFDAVVSVFSIFFVADMEGQAAELWRMVRPSGRLAVTTWGPRLFEPAESAWIEAVRRHRPDLHSAENPWDRIVTPEALCRLLADAGIPDADVVPEAGRQPFARPEDWWSVVMGSGNRGTMEQMSPDEAERVRAETLDWARRTGLDGIETNVIYAVAQKPA